MSSYALNHRLNVLGCVPKLLNLLFELAESSHGIRSFNLIKNIPVVFESEFKPLDGWQLNDFGPGEVPEGLDQDSIFALSVVGTRSKEIVMQHFKTLLDLRDEQFIRLIDPSSYVAPSAATGHGIQVESLCTIASNSHIGDWVNIKRNCSIGHHSSINDFVTINPGVVLSGSVTIGRSSMIGSGAVIKDNLTIGSNSVIGVGSVVVKDIPDNVVAFGNPCVVVRENM